MLDLMKLYVFYNNDIINDNLILLHETLLMVLKFS